MLRRLSIVLLVCTLSACGFHLRTTGDLKLPASVSTAHLDATLVDNRLRNMMFDAWMASGGQIAEPDSQSPRLVIFKEKVDREILSVSSIDAKVSEYLMDYRLGFRMLDTANKALTPDRFIRLRRSYTFDANTVLAKEREQEWLLEQLRLEAVQRVVREVAQINIKQNATGTLDDRNRVE